MNGPGQDSGLDTASRHEPSGTLPIRVGPVLEAMEGMLCRKHEMESQGKKAANRLKTHTASHHTIGVFILYYYITITVYSVVLIQIHNTNI